MIWKVFCSVMLQTGRCFSKVGNKGQTSLAISASLLFITCAFTLCVPLCEVCSKPACLLLYCCTVSIVARSFKFHKIPANFPPPMKTAVWNLSVTASWTTSSWTTFQYHSCLHNEDLVVGNKILEHGLFPQVLHTLFGDSQMICKRSFIVADALMRCPNSQR